MGGFELAQDFTASWEGGLSDDAADHGGLTHYGVSLAFLTDVVSTLKGRQFLLGIGVHPLPVSRDTIRNLDKSQARAIFRREFWDRLSLDDLPVQMGVLLYDAAVNTGCGQSVRLAQRGYNTAGVGTCLDVDGKFGPLTRAALTEHNTRDVRQAILDAREVFYRELVRRNASQKVFLRGWLNRVDDLRRYVETL